MATPTLAWRRLAFLLVLVVVIVASVTGLHGYRQAQHARMIQEHREAARAAVEAGDPHTALNHFAWYLAYISDDAEAFYQRARMQLLAEPDEPDAMRAAVADLRRVVELEPDHPAAERELMDLYRQLGEHELLRRLAERRLQVDRDDLDAARAYAAALAQLERGSAALRAVEAFLRHYGDDWRLHLLGIELRVRRGVAVNDQLDHARNLQARHAGDPAYALLLARTLLLARERDAAEPWLTDVANARPPDPAFARLVLATLDETQAYDAARDYLRRWSDELDHAPMQRELAWRLFEAGEFEALAQRFEGRPVGDPRLDADQLALWALAVHELGWASRAAELANEMAARDHDRRAHAWAAAFRAGQPGDASQLGDVIAALSDAIGITSHQPFFFALLADAYATGEEHEFAINLWQYVASARPSWATPFVRQAQLRLTLGEPEAAITAARHALVRQPGSVAAATVLAEAWQAHLDAKANAEGDAAASPDAAAAGELLAFLDQVQQVAPGEPATALLRLDWLLRLDRHDDARAWAAALLDQPRFVRDGDALLLLAGTARQHDLGGAEAARQAYVHEHGHTADLALADALAVADVGRVAQGWTRLTAPTASPSMQPGHDDGNRQGTHATEPDAFAWQRAQARYLEAVDDPRAGEAWARLVEAYPKHAAVQLEALRSAALWADREATDQAITHLTEAMGESALNWRVARARWLLADVHAGRHATRAIALLEPVREKGRNRLEPRLLLAEAHRLAGRPALALDELRAAARDAPEAVDLHLSMAELQHAQRQFAGARRQAQAIVASERASDAQRERAAELLAAIDEAEAERQ